MTEVPEGKVRVRITTNCKDDETQHTFYNGDEPIIPADQAERLVNESKAQIIEEGPVPGESENGGAAEPTT